MTRGLVILALCLGCELDERGLDYDAITRVYVEPSIPHALVIDACNAWGAAGVTCQATTVRDWASVDVLPDGVTDCEPDAEGNVWTGQTGVDEAGKPRIYLRSVCLGLDWNWPVIIAHEFGHVFGLGHTDGPGLMYDTTFLSTSAQPTESDMAEWKRVHDDHRRAD